MKRLKLEDSTINLGEIYSFFFSEEQSLLEISEPLSEKIKASNFQLLAKLETKQPIYGVTTGFGRQCEKYISTENAEELQNNLINYLLCGCGENFGEETCRVISILRLISISKGFSGVSLELVESLKNFLNKGLAPVIPKLGSLGASGDLIPLSYLAAALRGDGEVYCDGEIHTANDVFPKYNLKPYSLKAKEGLALVNGTSAMLGVALINLRQVRFLFNLATISSSWLCLALDGRHEAFGELVNRDTKDHKGQTQVALSIFHSIQQNTKIPNLDTDGKILDDFVQDRYSMRCVPQIMGPVYETLALVEGWMTAELNGVSDNALFSPTGKVGSGGNFYGGYISHGMDYLKICLGQVADLMDRQIMLLFDSSANKGLPDNLVLSDTNIFHGLNGIIQDQASLPRIPMIISPSYFPESL